MGSLFGKPPPVGGDADVPRSSDSSRRFSAGEAQSLWSSALQGHRDDERQTLRRRAPAAGRPVPATSPAPIKPARPAPPDGDAGSSLGSAGELTDPFGIPAAAADLLDSPSGSSSSSSRFAAPNGDGDHETRVFGAPKAGGTARDAPDAPEARDVSPAAGRTPSPLPPPDWNARRPRAEVPAAGEDSVACGPALLRARYITYLAGPAPDEVDESRSGEWLDLTGRLGEQADAARQWGDYEIEALLRLGGVGAVYRARQSNLDREVVLKMLQGRQVRDAEARRRFATEAMVTGALAHPNIVPVYELGIAQDGNFYYAMKEIGGSPWSERLAELGEEENLRVLMAVCDAVAFAHDRGFLHRDLKPANVMLGDYGEILLTDWGLAASLSPGNRKAKPVDSANACAGTPAYMAPETARGEAAAIGVAADIYMLGGILYEILTGHPPHSGGDGGALACLVAAGNNEIVPSPRRDEMTAIARRALAPRPSARYPDVKQFQEALRVAGAHGESLRLAADADTAYRRARTGGRYFDYAEAHFGYLAALKRWPGNGEALSRLGSVTRSYASRALIRGDYDQALALVEGRTDGWVEQLRRRAEEGLGRRRARDARERLWQIAAAVSCLLALAVTVLSVNGVMRAREGENAAYRKTIEALSAGNRPPPAAPASATGNEE